MPNPYSFVMGLDPRRAADARAKQDEEAAMRRDTAGMAPEDIDSMREEEMMDDRSGDIDMKSIPAFSDRPAPPAPGGGDWSGIESIGRAAEDTRRRAESYGQRQPPREGLQGIQDTALDILARAQARGGRR